MAKPKLNPPQLLSRAFSAYQAGNLLESEQLCQQVVKSERDSFDALYLLAVAQSKLGKFEVALTNYDRALVLRPKHTGALRDRGLALHKLKRFEDALASYDRALATQSDMDEVLLNRSDTLREMGRLEEALTGYDRAITIRPHFTKALLNRGTVLYELHRFEEALASYDQALAVRPNDPEVFFNRGVVLRKLNRLNEALASYDSVLKIKPDSAEALTNRGVTLHELKRFDEAVASYDRVLEMQPSSADVLANRGVTLHQLKQFEEALVSYDRALAMRPDFAEALNNRGLTLQQLKRFDEALASYDRSLILRPDYTDALNNRGLLLHDLRRFDEALANYDRALALRPDFIEAHWNAATLRLLIGDFTRGWAGYESRREEGFKLTRKRDFGRPLWLGAGAIEGKTILLHSEQGLGDTIQFCRYASLVAARGARAILEVEEPLRELLGSLAGVTKVVTNGDALPEFDLQCPLLSLPLAFGTQLETIPSATPYLSAPTAKASAWRDRLGKHERPRIGLVWAGNLITPIDRQRSIEFDRLAPLLQMTGCDFHSLQKGDAAIKQLRNSALRQRIFDWTDDLQNFSETAALVENLDLVITVDTSVAHLAGALGKPFWLLNRYNTCWRWLLDRDDSPWYPTARLFRQDTSRDWDEVIARVHAALRDQIQMS